MGKYDFTGLMEDTPKTSTNKYDFSGMMEDKPAELQGEKKKAWKISTPEELVKQGFSPTSAALLATGQQLSSPAYKYGNMLLGGLPDIALSKMGREAPETDINIATPFGEKNISGGINTTSNIAGFVRGLAMKAGTGVAGLIPKAARGAGIAAKAGIGAAKGATQFGLASYLHTPKDQFENWRARGMRGAAGAVGGAAIGTVSGLVEHFTGLLSQKSLLKTGEETRSGFGKFKQKLTNWFGKKLDKFQKAKPNQRVNIKESVGDLSKTVKGKEKLAFLKKESATLKKVLKRDGQATLRETQDISNEVKESLSRAKLTGKGVRPSDVEVFNTIDSIKNAKHAAFPEMRFTDSAYGKMSEYTHAVENFMKYGKTAQGIKTMVKNPEMRKSLETILPKETFDIIKETSAAQTVSKEVLRAVDYLVRYGILYTFMKSMINNIKSDEGAEMQGGGY